MAVRDDTLNPAAILNALHVPAATSMSLVREGTATALWRVTHGSQVSALRVLRPEQTAAFRRELAAIEAAREGGVPVPAIRAEGYWGERPAMLLDWLPGAPLAQAIRRAPWRAVPLGRAFGRIQAQIHSTMPRDPWPGTPSDWIEWAGEPDQRLQAALGRLSTRPPVLLHLDYHPMNVLTDGRSITGVLDWSNAHLGDRRADVARTYSVLMVEPIVPGRQPLALALVRRLLTWGWRRGYAEASGRLVDMPWFYAWAGEAMVHDLGPRVNDPDSWWEERHLAQIRVWGDQWRRRAEWAAARGTALVV